MMEFSINSSSLNLNYVLMFFRGHLLHELAFSVKCECTIGYLTPHGLVSDFQVVILPLYVQSKASNMYGFSGTSFRCISLFITRFLYSTNFVKTQPYSSFEFKTFRLVSSSQQHPISRFELSALPLHSEVPLFPQVRPELLLT